jgi:hypothetical protein
MLTPIIEESGRVISMGNDPRNLCTPHLDYWQRAHVTVLAPYADQAMNNKLKLGASNGFNVIH